MRVGQLAASFCNLSAKVATRALYLSPEEVIASTLSIDENAARYLADLPTTVAYNTVLINDPEPTVHAGYYYTWPDLGCASLYVSRWMTAIILHGLVVQQLRILYKSRYLDPDWVSSRYAPQMHQSATAILTFIGHICASVHYYLSFCPSLIASSRSSSDYPPLPCAAPINLMLRPLFVAGDSAFCPPATRAWILVQLRYLGLQMGVRQALFLERFIVDREREATDWLLRDRT